MRRLVLVVLAALAVVACAGGGDEPADPAVERLRAADARLQQAPEDPRALAEVIRVAVEGAQSHVNEETGTYYDDAEPFFARADAVWPRYLQATRRRPDVPIALFMVIAYSQGLEKFDEAARAMLYVTEEEPSANGYVRLMQLYAEAGNKREADLAGQKALELADPTERKRVREYIRALQVMPPPP